MENTDNTTNKLDQKIEPNSLRLALLILFLVVVMVGAWLFLAKPELNHLRQEQTSSDLAEEIAGSNRAPSVDEISQITGNAWPLPDDAIIVAYDYEEEPEPSFASFTYLTASSQSQVLADWGSYITTNSMTVIEESVDLLVFKDAVGEVTAVVLNSGEGFEFETVASVVFGLDETSYPEEVIYYKSFFDPNASEEQVTE